MKDILGVDEWLFTILIWFASIALLGWYMDWSYLSNETFQLFFYGVVISLGLIALVTND